MVSAKWVKVREMDATVANATMDANTTKDTNFVTIAN